MVEKERQEFFNELSEIREGLSGKREAAIRRSYRGCEKDGMDDEILGDYVLLFSDYQTLMKKGVKEGIITPEEASAEHEIWLKKNEEVCRRFKINVWDISIRDRLAEIVKDYREEQRSIA